MTFDEWWDVEVATKDTWVEDLCRSAWEAGWGEGLAEGYDVGYDDTGICPECLSEVKHKMDCGRGQWK